MSGSVSSNEWTVRITTEDVIDVSKFMSFKVVYKKHDKKYDVLLLAYTIEHQDTNRHYHIVFRFSESISANNFRKAFKGYEYSVKRVHDIQGFLQYINKENYMTIVVNQCLDIETPEQYRKQYKLFSKDEKRKEKRKLSMISDVVQLVNDEINIYIPMRYSDRLDFITTKYIQYHIQNNVPLKSFFFIRTDVINIFTKLSHDKYHIKEMVTSIIHPLA